MSVQHALSKQKDTFPPCQTIACTCHGKCTFGQGQEVASVACGGEHSLATTSGGEVFAWGWGRYGNLGVGPQEDRHVPTQVQIPLSTPPPPFSLFRASPGQGTRALCLRTQGLKVREMSCGAEHSMALAGNGAVYCWGWGAYGNLGDGHREDRCAPVKVGGRAGGGPKPWLLTSLEGLSVCCCPVLGGSEGPWGLSRVH